LGVNSTCEVVLATKGTTGGWYDAPDAAVLVTGFVVVVAVAATIAAAGAGAGAGAVEDGAVLGRRWPFCSFLWATAATAAAIDRIGG